MLSGLGRMGEVYLSWPAGIRMAVAVALSIALFLLVFAPSDAPLRHS